MKQTFAERRVRAWNTQLTRRASYTYPKPDSKMDLSTTGGQGRTWFPLDELWDVAVVLVGRSIGRVVYVEDAWLYF